MERAFPFQIGELRQGLPQKILKAPLSAQLGIDETSSEALNGRMSS
jgi:hypothetical protein